MIPSRRGIGRIEFRIRIQGQNEVHERLVEGLDEIGIVIWSHVTIKPIEVIESRSSAHAYI